MRILHFAATFAVAALMGLVSIGCSEDLPDGCALRAFGSSRAVREVDVTIHSGPTSSDADVFLDIGVATGTTASFDLDNSADNFEANDTDNFDFTVGGTPFSFAAITSMSIRVEEDLFASGPLDLDVLTIWLNGDAVFHGDGPSVLLGDGSVFDTACPAPL